MRPVHWINIAVRLGLARQQCLLFIAKDRTYDNNYEGVQKSIFNIFGLNGKTWDLFIFMKKTNVNVTIIIDIRNPGKRMAEV